MNNTLVLNASTMSKKPAFDNGANIEFVIYPIQVHPKEWYRAFMLNMGVSFDLTQNNIQYNGFVHDQRTRLGRKRFGNWPRKRILLFAFML